MLILLVVLALIAAAAYAGYKWFGQEGLGAAVGLGVAIFAALWALGGLQFT